MMQTQHELRQARHKKKQDRADEDLNGLMAEMTSLMAPARTGTMAKKTTERKTVQQRIREGKNTAMVLNEAKVASEAAIGMSQRELHEVMGARGLLVSHDKKKDVRSLINSYYEDADNKFL